jgi:eukaryotic-like serine/threonine-protein kinase
VADDNTSQSRELAGTLRYMAPERFRGLSDGRCDVYALGAMLYETLTLRPAFVGHNQLGLIRRIEDEPPVLPRQLDHRIPRDLETIVTTVECPVNTGGSTSGRKAK